MGKKNQVSGPHFLSDEIQKISFSQSSFMKNMRFRKDTASAKSLNPIFSVMKSKTQRKCVFFTEQFHKKYEIPEGHCQCQVSEPHFLCDEVLKNTKKTFFFSQSSFKKNMRFWKDTASAKSLNLIIFVQLLLNTSSYFFKIIFSLR